MKDEEGGGTVRSRMIIPVRAREATFSLLVGAALVGNCDWNCPRFWSCSDNRA